MNLNNFLPFMHRAIALAFRGRPFCAPNPAVGAVIVKNGRIVGEGWHERFGGPHAEVMALADAQKRGEPLEGATLVVTLEPCNHFGKTPPCSRAVLNSGIKHVICGTYDPDTTRVGARVGAREANGAGGGAKFLQEHGVAVEFGLCAAECEYLLRDFLFWQTSELPYITVKMATTLDGCIATRTGNSRYITGLAARRRVHTLREEAHAVMIGGNTLRLDNPRLDVRPDDFGGAACEEPCERAEMGEAGEELGQSLGQNLGQSFFYHGFKEPQCFQLPKEACLPYNPLAVVVTGRGPKEYENSFLVRERAKETIFLGPGSVPFASENNDGAGLSPAASVTCVPLEFDERKMLSKESLEKGLKVLRKDYGCWRILCEGGSSLAFSLLRHGFARELELHMSTSIMGDVQAKKVFEGAEISELSQMLDFELLKQGMLGRDIALLLGPVK